MAQGEPQRPNIIWIFGDQHRAQALSCMGDPNVSTPNIDRLAGEGTVFTHAVSGYPLCCPFRGSLLTSQYPQHCVPGHEHQMPPDQPTVAHAFNDAGYHTAYVGKWHVDGAQEAPHNRAAMHIVPPERRGGFGYWVGFENNNSQWDCWVHGGSGDYAFHYRLPKYETDALTDIFIEHVTEQCRLQREEDGQPFFAVLSVQPPHDPYVAPPEFMQRHTPASLTMRPNVPDVPWVQDKARRELAGAYSMIENLDWNVGRIIDTLFAEGIAHNTYIMFFSDHGDMHGSHGQFRKTAPWEEAMRIPMIISGGTPHYFNRTARIDAPMNHVDIAPTALGLCGIAVPSWMQGADHSAYCFRYQPDPETPDSAFIQSIIPTKHDHSIDRPWRAIVTRDGWKYVVLENQPWLMFNLNDDPYEEVNLAHNNLFAEQRRTLQNRLARWIEETGDSFPLPEV